MSKRLPVFSPGRLIFVATALIATYFLVSGAVSGIRHHQLNRQESGLRAEIQEMETRYERLQALEDYLSSDEYIEAVAREQLGLVKPGETAIIAISTQPSPTPAPGESQLWWDILIR